MISLLEAASAALSPLKNTAQVILDLEHQFENHYMPVGVGR